MSWNAVRYYFYLDYLKSRGRAFEDIFLTDTRDVLFQRDPFAAAVDGELLVTFEDASKVIGSCGINSMTFPELPKDKLDQFEAQRQEAVAKVKADNPTASAEDLAKLTEDATKPIDDEQHVTLALGRSGWRANPDFFPMMIAWYFATALCKQWDAVIPFIQENRLDRWTHNKAIQKAVESYRITGEQKQYLRTLRMK